MQKYLTSYCPKQMPIHEWLGRLTKLNDNLVSTDIKDITIKLKYNLPKLQKDVLDILDEVNPVGWQTQNQSVDFYKSISLRSNPNHQDNIDENYSSIGTPKNKTGEFFFNQTHNHKHLKDSYYDTLSFIEPTTASTTGELGNFMSKIKRTVVRSRISTIDGNYVPDNTVGWHRDEPVFINLRLNVPITTGEEFFFEMEGIEPYNLKIGNLYTWDTNIAHRVFTKQQTKKKRTHLVIGCCPWFDYNAEDKSWTPNEFFGKKHPFEMLLDGDIISNDIFDTQ